MGQKVNPIGFRLGYIKKSISRWFPSDSKKFADLVKADAEIRKCVLQRLPAAAHVSSVNIERTGSNIKITIRTGKPGVVIGKKGEDVEKLRAYLTNRMGATVQILIDEIRKPECDAQLVAHSIAEQLERRVMFRRAMKRAVQGALRQGAKGIRVNVAGRLGGAEIARTEWYREGQVPLHTLRADIDYAVARANTTYGVIGIKVWIYKGQVLKSEPQTSPSEVA